MKFADDVLNPAVEAGPFAPLSKRYQVFLTLDILRFELDDGFLVRKPGSETEIISFRGTLEPTDFASLNEYFACGCQWPCRETVSMNDSRTIFEKFTPYGLDKLRPFRAIITRPFS